jgi:glutamine synthetase
MSAVNAYLAFRHSPTTAAYEYIWQGGTGELRSKVRYLALSSPEDVLAEVWNYDGSSTGQATTETSEVLLVPVRVYCDSTRPDSFYVLCESTLPDGSPALGNSRSMFPAEAAETHAVWFGFEQEFFVEAIIPSSTASSIIATADQGPYYCAVAVPPIPTRIREATEAIVTRARALGIGIAGWNLEVAPHQTEIQVFGPALKACDDLTMLRYLCHRVLAEHNLRPVFDSKPYPDLNGSGLHTNVSTAAIRAANGTGLEAIKSLMPLFAERHMDHIAVYGTGNEARLTGRHETSSLHEFSYSVGGRHTSIRIPRSVALAGGGYFEDRRPAANADPYAVGTAIVNTIRLAYV